MQIKNSADRERLLGEASIGQLILRLSLPTITSMVAIALFSFVDAAYISRLGIAPLGAVSVAFPIFAVIGSVGQTFGAGAASWISRLLGSGDREAASKAASVAFFSVILVGGVVAGLGLLFLQPILKLLGATHTILPYALKYSRILILANILTMLNITMSNLVRAEGNAKLSMYSVVMSSGLNIALDPVFIFLFHMGIQGAAVATILSQAASFALLVTSFVRNKNHCRIRLKLAFSGLQWFAKILRVGAATFFLNFLGSMGLALINNAAMRFGDGAVAAAGLTFRILMLGMYPVYGFCIGFQPVAGYSYGAKNFKRIFRALKASLLWTLPFSVSFSICVVIFAPQIVTLFSSDPEVISIGTRMLRATTVLLPLFDLQIVFAILFQALGRALPAALIILSRQGFFFLPAIFILPRFWGLNGVIFSQPIADAATSILAAFLTFFVLRALNRERVQSEKESVG